MSDWFSALSERLADRTHPPAPEQPSPLDIWKILQERIQVGEYRPQASTDVIFQEVQGRQGPYFVLKNTCQKAYLRLSPAEYNLWSQMDGQKSVQELIVEHFMTSGNFAHNLVVRLVEQLYRYHMLAESPVAIWSQLRAQIGKRSWGYRLSAPASFVLTQRLSFKGIDGWIGALYRFGGWLFFTRGARAIFLLVSLLGLAAFTRVLSNPSYVFLGDNFVVGLAVLWIVSIFPVVIHELGHALTVKHFGREVPKGGLMLYFGMPAAFVETTDIWLEPRRARLAVTWNGPYTGLILGGAAALAMYLFPASPANNLLFKLAGFAYLTVFLNVNPLLKLDGYYLLSDALDIPSLREKSLSFVQNRLVGRLLQRRRFTREELVFTIFGLLSVVWTLYAVFLAAFFWRTRLQHSLQAVLGSGYPLVTRILSFLLLAALVSFLVLIALQLFRLGRILVSRFSRSGFLDKHWRFALFVAGLVVGLGVSVPAISPTYALPISAALGLAVLLLAILQVIPFSRPYLWSPRGLAYLAFGGGIFLGGLSLIPPLLTGALEVVNGLQWAVLILFLAGFLFIIWPLQEHLNLRTFLVGILVGVVGWILLGWLAALRIGDPRLWLLAVLGMTGAWAVGSLRGGARLPAVGLFSLGGLVIGLSWFFNISFGDLPLVGVLLLAAGGLHLTFARLPRLTTYRPEEIVDDTHWVIGESLGILVRRAIAQIYFESGEQGVKHLGRDFSQAMYRQGIHISIRGNNVDDGELPQRDTPELAEIYGLVFDELHALLRHELGPRMGTLTFSYGIDLLPWEHREVVSELILSRRAWGLALTQAVRDARQERRKLLKKVPLFISCTDQELDRLASSLRIEQVAAGETILRQGEPGDKFYIIERGQVAIWQRGEDGLERRVDKLGRGQHFGQVALVSNAPRNATVRAEIPTALLSLDKRDFDQLVKKYLGLAGQVNAGVRHSWLLRGMPIFDELDSADMELLTSRLEPETFREKQTVFHEGDRGDKFYIVESGKLAVFRTVQGQPVEVTRRGPGEYVGEIALLQNLPRTATIVALEDTVLLSLKAEDFQQLVGRFLAVGRALTKTSTRRLSNVQRVDSAVFAPAQQPEV